MSFREVHYTDEFTSDEWSRLSYGLIPAAMEDKWFIFCEETTLHIHRSWTGRRAYQLEFELVPEGARVTHALCAVSEKHPDWEDPYHAALLRFILRRLVLGHSEEFPVPGSESSWAGAFQHHIAGTAALERMIPSRHGWWSRMSSRLWGRLRDRKH